MDDEIEFHAANGMTMAVKIKRIVDVVDIEPGGVPGGEVRSKILLSYANPPVEVDCLEPGWIVRDRVKLAKLKPSTEEQHP